MVEFAGRNDEERGTLDTVDHVAADALDAGLPLIVAAPRDEGTVMLIAVRPDVGEREILTEATLDPGEGVIGDMWSRRPSKSTPDGSPHPEMQVTLMNSRVAALLAGETDRWALAGDQIYVDLDLSEGNLPAGTRLGVGSAVLEVTGHPHTGCQKFSQRFGVEALRFVNSPSGREMRLRGMNTRVVTAGVVRVGDRVHKLAD